VAASVGLSTHPLTSRQPSPDEPSERARREPVWLALSEFYLDTELQSADFRRIRAVFDQSGYSEREIRRIDYEEVGPILVYNLLSPAGEWVEFEEVTLLTCVAKRAVKRVKLRSKPPVKWLWQKALSFFNDAYFQSVFGR
jgi:hypothetical protein